MLLLPNGELCFWTFNFFKMKQQILLVAIIGGLTILNACGEDSSNEKKVEKVSQKLDNEDAIEAEIAAIEEGMHLS